MPTDIAFLNSKEKINKNNAEYKLLLALKDEFKDKRFVVKLDKLECIKSIYQDCRNLIIDECRSFNFSVFSYSETSGQFEQSSIPSHLRTQTDQINYCLQISQNEAYVFINANNFCLLFNGGELCPDFNQQFYDLEEIIKQLNKKIPIQDIQKAFTGYQELRRTKGWSEIIIENKIRNDISEQMLRNCLLSYLDKNMIGQVIPEHCTSLTSDEESVDISVIDRDGTIVIIEVKFYIKKNFCVDSNVVKYSAARFKDGYDQINRYCSHLKESGQNIHAAYLYMFYADTLAKGKIAEIADRYLQRGYAENKYPETKIHLRETVLDDMFDFNRT